MGSLPPPGYTPQPMDTHTMLIRSRQRHDLAFFLLGGCLHQDDHTIKAVLVEILQRPIMGEIANDYTMTTQTLLSLLETGKEPVSTVMIWVALMLGCAQEFIDANQ